MRNAKLMTMLAFAGVLLAFSCEEDEPVPTLPYEEVFGSWDWYSSTAGLTQITTYADSVDYDQTLEITEQRDYLWKKDTSVVSDVNFTIEVDTIEGKEAYFLVFNDSTQVDQSFEIKDQDTLLLSDQCADCSSHVFVRK